MPRLFIAVELPKAFKREVAAVRNALREQSVSGRFVPDNNFHITLHFIGESRDLAGAAAAMNEAVRGIRPFALHLCGVGSFLRGQEHTPFVKVAGDLQELNALYEGLEAALFDQGFSRECRRFTPHITLGREVVLPDPGMLSGLRPNASMQVNGITLFESRRAANGAMEYLPLHVARF